jgi:hypothetical protein
MTKETPTVTVDLSKCARSLAQKNDIDQDIGLTQLNNSFKRPENQSNLFFEEKFPGRSISLTMDEKNIIITYDDNEKKPIAKFSSGEVIPYEVGNEDDELKKFTKCLNKVTNNNISEKQIDYIVNNFSKENMMKEPGLDLTYLYNNQMYPADSSHYDTLHIKFDKDENIELTIMSNISIYKNNLKGRPTQTIIGYSEYKDIVDNKGELKSSKISIQGDNKYFLFDELKKLDETCISESKEPNIKTKIVEHIINTGKEIKDKSLELNFGGKPIPDYQGKTIVEEILINKMVNSLNKSFQALDGEKLTDENKNNIKKNLKEIITPFAKIDAFKELTGNLSSDDKLDAIVRRSARERKGVKQDFKTAMAKYFRKIIDLFKRNKKIEGIVKTSDVVKAFKKHVSTQDHPLPVKKKPDINTAVSH